MLRKSHPAESDAIQQFGILGELQQKGEALTYDILPNLPLEISFTILALLTNDDLRSLSLTTSQLMHLSYQFADSHWGKKLKSRFPFASVMQRYQDKPNGCYRTLNYLKEVVDVFALACHPIGGSNKNLKMREEFVRLFTELWWYLIEKNNVTSAIEFIENNDVLNNIDIITLLTGVYNVDHASEDLYLLDSDGRNLLQNLATEKKQETLDQLYKFALSRSSNSRNPDYYNNFSLAILFNQLVKIDELLARGERVNQTIPGKFPLNCLHIAAMYGYDECLDKLLSNGATGINTESHYGTPLLLAVRFGSTAMVIKLLNAGAHINFASQHSTPHMHKIIETPLSMAVKMENLALVNLFIAHGANTNCTLLRSNASDCVPLPSAYMLGDLNMCPSQNQLEIIKALLNAGTKLNAPFKGVSWGNPIAIAINFNYFAFIKLFIEYGSDFTEIQAKIRHYEDENLAMLVFILANCAANSKEISKHVSITIDDINEETKQETLIKQLDTLLCAGIDIDILFKIFSFENTGLVETKLYAAMHFNQAIQKSSPKEIYQELLNAFHYNSDLTISMYQNLVNDERVLQVSSEKITLVREQLSKIARETRNDKLNSLIAMNCLNLSSKSFPTEMEHQIYIIRQLEQLDPANEDVDKLKLQTYYSLIFGKGVATSWDEILNNPYAKEQFEEIKELYLFNPSMLQPFFIMSEASTAFTTQTSVSDIGLFAPTNSTHAEQQVATENNRATRDEASENRPF